MNPSTWKKTAAAMLLLLGTVGGCALHAEHDSAAPVAAANTHETALRLAPPKDGRTRPLVVVLADNAGTETTDFVMPFAVLKESGAADVLTVSTTPGTVTLIPALRVRADMTLAQFDAATPRGADIVIVPAVMRNDRPVLLDWLRAQADKGATVVSICEGAWVVANAGLLEGKHATTHWFAMNSIAEKFPGTTWVRNSRWVVDGKMMSTTGVSASVPASLVLVEAIAGHAVAERTAQSLGVAQWDSTHDSTAFGFSAKHFGVIANNWLAFWRHESFALAVQEGVDEMAAAQTADAWSRTYRSRAVATGSDTLVRSRRGLLIETEATAKPSDVLPPGSAAAGPVALDTTLDDIATRYGEATANLVALELEHPRHRPASTSTPAQAPSGVPLAADGPIVVAK
jgi:putative intracellular protease/amidase